VFASGVNITVSIAGSNLSRNGGNGLSQNNLATVRSHGNNAVSGNLLGDTFGILTPLGLL
jgi:hypothetical protein